jgi:long-chain acyl-CoA synthetase
MKAAREPLDPQRRQAALEELSASVAKGMSIAVWAKYMPDAPAVYSASGDRTFAQLNFRCNQLVRALRSRGLVSGDSVALMCSNRTEFAEVFWAVRRSGLRITALNWHLTGEETAYIVDDCDAKVFFVDARYADAAKYVAERVAQLTARIAIGASLPGFEDYEAVLQGFDGSDIDDAQLGSPMLYTSGTTGRPKGVYRATPPATPTHPAVTANYKPGESVHLVTGPLYHAAPLSFSLAVPHGQGAALVLMDGWDTERALELIEKYRVTHTHMVPTMFHRLLSLPPAARNRDISSLQYILHGAAPCPVPVKQALIDWVGPIVYEYYAATEGTGAYVDSATWLQRPGTVGKPETDDHVRILDEEGRELARRTAGLIYLKAPEQGRFTYYKDTQKTNKAYRGDYYTLGDMGYLDEDGYLYLTDRSAHLIISGGVNIYPAEVEAVLLTHPAIADVGVIGVPNAEWGEEVKAVALLQPGRAASAQLQDELIDYCRARLAHYKCPRTVDFVAELPRHDNGKLYKQKLREMYRQTPRG